MADDRVKMDEEPENDETAEPIRDECDPLDASTEARDAAPSGEEIPNEDETPASEVPSGPDLRLVRETEDGVEVTVEQIVEAILFSSDSPLAASKISPAVGGVTPRQVGKVVEALNRRYAETNSSFRIEQIAGGFQMMTRPEYAGYIQRLYKVRSESRLSPAALETLAVVAYKQPVLRAEIEAIRGVACGEVLRSLMDKMLIKIVGRAEELGRPMLYGTTKRFLEIFGLRSLDDLPKVPDLQLPHRAEPAPPATPAEPTEPPTATAMTESSPEPDAPPSPEPPPAPPTSEPLPEASEAESCGE